MSEKITEREKIAAAIRNAASILGTGNAAGSMGAIEWLGLCLKEGSTEVASNLGDIATSINNLAEAIRETKWTK